MSSLSPPPPPHSPWQPQICYPSLRVCLLWTPHTDGTTYYTAVRAWLPSLSTMVSRFTPVAACQGLTPLQG